MTRRVYFDYCATTPVHPQVRKVMFNVLEEYGNPSSLHWAGQQARSVLNGAREQVAAGIGAQVNEIIFTSGATEANNMALRGVMHATDKRHLITSGIEHHATLHTAESLEKEGFEVTYLPVSASGLVDPDDVRTAIRPDTALISIMLVNNEVGVIEPVSAIGEVAHEHGVLMHTDAVQALGYLPVAVDDLNVDYLSLSAHKIYGPKGIGALYVRENSPIASLLYGGSQEGKHRPGTENVPGIAALGAAVELVTAHKESEYTRLNTLRHQLIDKLRHTVPESVINGPPEHSAPHVLSISFPGCDGEMLLFLLNKAGIALSMGSACTAEDMEPSHVLTAMGLPLDHIDGTLRISLGYSTTSDDVEYLCAVLPDIVAQCH